MRRLLLTENITADGRIEMLDEWFNPSPDGDIQDWLEGMDHLGAPSDAVLLGRQTFEDFRGHWPQHTDESSRARSVPAWRCFDMPRPTAELPRNTRSVPYPDPGPLQDAGGAPFRRLCTRARRRLGICWGGSPS